MPAAITTSPSPLAHPHPHPRSRRRGSPRLLNSVPILVLDGGMGTYLEDGHGMTFDTSKPAWSSSVAPALLKVVHGEYLAAGADVVLTATYQATTANMACGDGGDGDGDGGDGGTRMLLVARQALDAVDEASADAGADTDAAAAAAAAAAVALSLSPYGGTMAPSTEYTGAYPADMDAMALARWHYERLAVYCPTGISQPLISSQAKSDASAAAAATPPTPITVSDASALWEKHHGGAGISYVAFETLVSAAECSAVGSTMGMLRRQRPSIALPKHWVCANFPDSSTENKSNGLQSPVGESARDVVTAMLTPPPSPSPPPSPHPHDERIAHEWVKPWGVGINCTKLRKLSRLILEFEQGVAEYNDMQKERKKESREKKNVGLENDDDENVDDPSHHHQPWLVIYPDGALNLRYNSRSKQWEEVAAASVSNQDEEGAANETEGDNAVHGHSKTDLSWAMQLIAVLQETTRRGCWPGIVVGGCCKTTPTDIAELVELLEKAKDK